MRRPRVAVVAIAMLFAVVQWRIVAWFEERLDDLEMQAADDVLDARVECERTEQELRAEIESVRSDLESRVDELEIAAEY